MHFLITDIKFDCSLDDIDWTEKDQLETEEMLPHSYIGSTWEADSEDDLIEELSCASGWLISELDYKIVLNQLVIQTGRPRQPVGKVAHYRPQSVRPHAYNRCMKTKTLLSSPQTLQDLQDFMFDTMCSADMAVDWFCDRFNVSATDDVIDFVVDAHFGMFADQ